MKTNDAAEAVYDANPTALAILNLFDVFHNATFSNAT